jgi:hypothetical protein
MGNIFVVGKEGNNHLFFFKMKRFFEINSLFVLSEK